MKQYIEKIQSFFDASSLHIGLDVGSSSIKAVVVKNNAVKRPEVVAIGYEDTPSGCVTDGQINDPKTLTDLIKTLLNKTGIKYKKKPVNIGLRGLSIVLKRVLLPYQKPEEMVQQIWVEAQQQVDADLTNWNLGYQLLGKPDAEGQVSVMIVAAKKGAVEDFQKIFDELEMDLHVVDCDIFCLENIVDKIYGHKVDETNILMEIGHDTTQFVMVTDSQPVLCRSFPLGGGHLSELIGKSLNIPFIQAESLKISANSSGELLSHSQLEKCLQQHALTMCEEVKKTLDFFATSQNQIVFDGFQKLYISGGGSSVAFLGERLSRFLRAELVSLNPFDALKMSQELDTSVKGFAHNFTVACGLAIRHLGDRIS